LPVPQRGTIYAWFPGTSTPVGGPDHIVFLSEDRFLFAGLGRDPQHDDVRQNRLSKVGAIRMGATPETPSLAPFWQGWGRLVPMFRPKYY